MRYSRFILGIGLVVLGHWPAFAQSNIDPEAKFAWSENLGWTNWRDANGTADGVIVHDTFLSGYIWCEAVGWITLGYGSPPDGPHYANVTDDDFGVNVDPETGDLFGLAWGENVGWVNFDTRDRGEERARFDDCEHRFLGFAWGENVGWINLDDLTHFVGVGPCAPGDYRCDGDLDLDDYAALGNVLSGPGVAVECPALDADHDGDVDLIDFAAFQAAFTGE